MSNCATASWKNIPDSIPSKDTQCYTIDVLRNLMDDADRASILDSIVANLDLQIMELEAEVKELKVQDFETRASYEREIVILKDQRGIFQAEIDALKKALRKERRKRFWTGVIGMATTITMGYIALTK